MDFEDAQHFRNVYGAWENSYSYYLFDNDELDELLDKPLNYIKKLYLKAKFAVKNFPEFDNNQLKHLYDAHVVSLYSLPVRHRALPSIFKFVAPVPGYTHSMEYSHIPANLEEGGFRLIEAWYYFLSRDPRTNRFGDGVIDEIVSLNIEIDLEFNGLDVEERKLKACDYLSSLTTSCWEDIEPYL